MIRIINKKIKKPIKLSILINLNLITVSSGRLLWLKSSSMKRAVVKQITVIITNIVLISSIIVIIF